MPKKQLLSRNSSWLRIMYPKQFAGILAFFNIIPIIPQSNHIHIMVGERCAALQIISIWTKASNDLFILSLITSAWNSFHISLWRKDASRVSLSCLGHFRCLSIADIATGGAEQLVCWVEGGMAWAAEKPPPSITRQQSWSRDNMNGRWMDY